MIPFVELHVKSVGHGSMHGIVWNHMDHMIPCMELHGSLMNLDPGSHWCHSVSNFDVNGTRELKVKRAG